MRIRRHTIPLIAAFAVLALAGAGALAGTASAACGVKPPSTIASALGQTNAEEIPLLTVPGPAWSVEQDCTFIAWTGTRPTSKPKIEAGIAAGTYAVARIATWAPATGLFFKGVQQKGFRETLSKLAQAARVDVVKGLHGSSFSPKRYGASTKGWKGKGKTFREARGVWSDKTKLRIIWIAVRAQRKGSIAGVLNQVAGVAVPAFGL